MPGGLLISTYMDKKELSNYMAGLGKTGGEKLKAKKLKENPNYYREIGLKGAEAKSRKKLDGQAVGNSKKPHEQALD